MGKQTYSTTLDRQKHAAVMAWLSDQPNKSEAIAAALATYHRDHVIARNQFANYLYIVYNPATGLCKIASGADPQPTIKMMSAHAGAELDILLMQAAGIDGELAAQQLRETFAYYNTIGAWLQLPDDVLYRLTDRLGGDFKSIADFILAVEKFVASEQSQNK